MSLPASPGCSLAAGSGRTLVCGSVAVAGAETDPVEAGDALADALANAVAEDEDICAVRDGYFSCPLCSPLTLSSLARVSAGFSGWVSLFTSSVLRSSPSTLPARAISEGSWETVGSCTSETDG